MSRDDGFSLIEAVMASFIVVMLFAGFGKSMSAAFDGSHDNSIAQEATALAVEQTEFARSLDWGELAMAHVSDTAPFIDPETRTIYSEAIGTDQDEPLRVDSDGLVYPVSTELVDGTAYTVYRYVSDSLNGLRRVVVFVSWESDGVVANYRTSTMISEVSTR